MKDFLIRILLLHSAFFVTGTKVAICITLTISLVAGLLTGWIECHGEIVDEDIHTPTLMGVLREPQVTPLRRTNILLN